MRLLRTELARFAARRAIRILLLLLFLVIGLSIAGIGYEAQPPTAAERLTAEQEAASLHRDCLAAGRQTETGGDGVAVDQQLPDEQALGCDALPTAADLLGPEFVLADQLESWMIPYGVLLTMAFFLVGATFGGAEWSTAAIVAQLVAEPRRMRVFAAKAGGLLVGLLITAIVALALSTAGLYLIGTMVGPIGTIDQSQLMTAGWAALRSVTLALLGGVGAFAVAHTLRSTGGTLGAAFAYGVVGEIALRSLEFTFPQLEIPRWLLGTHLAGWLSGGTSLQLLTGPCAAESCETVTIAIPLWHSGLYLGILSVVFLGLAAIVFRRRDVA